MKFTQDITSTKKRRLLYRQLFLGGSLLLLLGSSVLWALLGARLHVQNADQLVDAYLFKDAATFHAAQFPASHSFLLKWPIFWLVALFGTSANSLAVATIGCVLATVGGFAYVLHRIERRPLVLGSLYIALASVLLMVPYVPSAGTLLPVNMAMLTTRNLEYLVYLIGLALVVRARSMRDYRFFIAVGLFVVVGASDKLFSGINIGGAIIALLAYGLVRNNRMVSLAARWLLAALVASALAAFSLGLIGLTKFAQLAGHGSGAGPYGSANSLKEVAVGAVFAGTGTLSNLGANLVQGANRFTDMPSALYTNLFSWGGLPFIVNLAIGVAGVLAIFSIMRPGLTRRRNGKWPATGTAQDFVALLACSMVTALAAFIATKHAYAADARYVGLVTFLVFTALAAYFRRRKLRARTVLWIAGGLAIAVALAVISNVQQYRLHANALASIHDRNQRIAGIMAGRKSNLLVGDYWRVLPIRHISRTPITASPLANCTTPQTALSSATWRPDLTKRPFVYLLTYQGNLTNYPNCSLEQVIAAYGRPNSSIIIDGTPAQPRELLLFFDKGATPPKPDLATGSPSSAGLLPVSLDDVRDTHCTVPTVMNIVAHEDDDILFMNPDVERDIKAGKCVRTVYMTAGDAGQGADYWHGRMKGAQQAYAEMTGDREVWQEQTVRLSTTSFITIANQRHNPSVSLIFFALPDGNPKGSGFDSSGNQSLARLLSGNIGEIRSVDTYSRYSRNQLEDAIVSLLHAYQATAVRTQADVASSQHPDHSDHIAVGRLVTVAYQRYQAAQYGGQVTLPFERYVGYPIHDRPANLSAEDKERKTAVFLAYAAYDPGACFSKSKCRHHSSYDAYVERQYKDNE